jgi:SAM-dependent methyltransferase
MKDTWAVGAAYEPYIGRWSRVVARPFVDGLAQPPDLAWLDVGCGTGALSSTVLAHAGPRCVAGIDPSAGFVADVRRAIDDPRFSAMVADAQALPFGEAGFDATVSGLVLNFVPQPMLAVREMKRVTRPGGVVAAYVWDYADRMQLIRRFWDAAIEEDGAAGPLDEAVRFPLCRADALSALWREAGLSQVQVVALDVPTVFRDFDDLWQPFLGAQGPAPGYLTGLPPHRRDRLQALLRQRLPVQADGTIALAAGAWAVQGRA